MIWMMRVFLGGLGWLAIAMLIDGYRRIRNQ